MLNAEPRQFHIHPKNAELARLIIELLTAGPKSIAEITAEAVRRGILADNEHERELVGECLVEIDCTPIVATDAHRRVAKKLDAHCVLNSKEEQVFDTMRWQRPPSGWKIVTIPIEPAAN